MVGLAISVDVEKSKYAEQIKEKCMEEGLLITTQGSQLVMFPALNIKASAIDSTAILKSSQHLLAALPYGCYIS